MAEHACALGVSDPVEAGATTVRVRARFGAGPTTERALYRGENDFAGRPDRYAIPIAVAESAGVLGEGLRPCHDFLSGIVRATGLANETTERQERLLSALGDVARLDPNRPPGP
jgi:hypothetical protein